MTAPIAPWEAQAVEDWAGLIASLDGTVPDWMAQLRLNQKAELWVIYLECDNLVLIRFGHSVPLPTSRTATPGLSTFELAEEHVYDEVMHDFDGVAWESCQTTNLDSARLMQLWNQIHVRIAPIGVGIEQAKLTGETQLDRSDVR